MFTGGVSISGMDREDLFLVHQTEATAAGELEIEARGWRFGGGGGMA